MPMSKEPSVTITVAMDATPLTSAKWLYQMPWTDLRTVQHALLGGMPRGRQVLTSGGDGRRSAMPNVCSATGKIDSEFMNMILFVQLSYKLG